MQTITRRNFLQAAAIAALPPSSHAAFLKPPVIDTHVHCFAGTKNERFPYHANGPYQPEDAATPEKLLADMNASGVNSAIIVHPEPYQDDHRYLEHCLAIGGKRFKGTALVFADQPKSVAQLPDLAKKLSIVAVRIHAYNPERLPPWDKPSLQKLWKMASELGLAMQLHLEPRYAPRFTPLIKEFKDTTVIIDHLGRPLQGTPEEHAHVVKWAGLPNTVMKLSSFPQKDEPGKDKLKPVVKQLVAEFGTDRLICGGGIYGSANRESVPGVFNHIGEYLGPMSIDDLNKIYGLNAHRLFKFA
jgi:predicted TIM-barrel fold metal-dependent hydrolase